MADNCFVFMESCFFVLFSVDGLLMCSWIMGVPEGFSFFFVVGGRLCFCLLADIVVSMDYWSASWSMVLLKDSPFFPCAIGCLMDSCCFDGLLILLMDYWRF